MLLSARQPRNTSLRHDRESSGASCSNPIGAAHLHVHQQQQRSIDSLNQHSIQCAVPCTCEVRPLATMRCVVALDVVLAKVTLPCVPRASRCAITSSSTSRLVPRATCLPRSKRSSPAIANHHRRHAAHPRNHATRRWFNACMARRSTTHSVGPLGLDLACELDTASGAAASRRRTTHSRTGS